MLLRRTAFLQPKKTDLVEQKKDLVELNHHTEQQKDLVEQKKDLVEHGDFAQLVGVLFLTDLRMGGVSLGAYYS